jgi:hypothetical protein
MAIDEADTDGDGELNREEFFRVYRLVTENASGATVWGRIFAHLMKTGPDDESLGARLVADESCRLTGGDVPATPAAENPGFSPIPRAGLVYGTRCICLGT